MLMKQLTFQRRGRRDGRGQGIQQRGWPGRPLHPDAEAVPGSNGRFCSAASDDDLHEAAVRLEPPHSTSSKPTQSLRDDDVWREDPAADGQFEDFDGENGERP